MARLQRIWIDRGRAAPSACPRPQPWRESPSQDRGPHPRGRRRQIVSPSREQRVPAGDLQHRLQADEQLRGVVHLVDDHGQELSDRGSLDESDAVMGWFAKRVDLGGSLRSVKGCAASRQRPRGRCVPRRLAARPPPRRPPRRTVGDHSHRAAEQTPRTLIPSGRSAEARAGPGWYRRRDSNPHSLAGSGF